MSGDAADRAARLIEDGVAAFQRGDAAAAEAAFAAATRAAPDHADAWSNRAAALIQLGRFAAAATDCDTALALAPAHPSALVNRATALSMLDRPAETLAACERALAVNPRHVGTLVNRGNALRALGRAAEARDSYSRAIALDPGNVPALVNRGHAGLDLHEAERALADYDAALAVDGANVPALAGRAAALARLSRFDEAAACARSALAHAPDHLDALNNLGSALLSMHRADDALACFDRVLALQPGHAIARANRGNALLVAKRSAEAAAAFAALVAIDPAYEFALGNLMLARQQVCDWSDFDATAARIAEELRAGRPAARPLTVALISDDPALQRRSAELLTGRAAATTPAQPARRGPRMRVAYLSADLGEHAVGRLMAGVIERHDRARVEVSALAFRDDAASPLRARIARACAAFVDAERMSDRDVAQWLRERGIDIAVDLTGHTRAGRPGIAAFRGAAVQTAYLGFPGTMGSPAYDYLFADGFVIPPALECHYAERIVRLPDTFFPAPALDGAAAGDRARAGLPARGVVFCCFNNSNKITPEMFGAWTAILSAVPDSVLWLRQDSDAGAANLRRAALHRGIDPARLVFAPRVAADVHAGRLALADLFLDTFPYGAHSTAAEFLAAGVPVLSRAGRGFASRVAGSLLTAAGLPELIALSREDYIKRAVALGNDAAARAALRDRLRAARSSAPLFDANRLPRALEAAFAVMAERAARGLPPQGFDVP